MNLPEEYVVSGYATKEEAIKVWSNLKHNETLAVVGVNIGLSTFNPASECCCWFIQSVFATER